MSTRPKSTQAGAKPSAAKPAAAKKAPERSAADQGFSTPGKPRFDLAPILEALRRRVPKAKAAEAEAFARCFYARMTRDEYIEHGAEGWAALAAGMLEFAATRKPNK